MCRLQFIEPEKVNESTKELFKKLVLVPNLFCIIANSDVVIDCFTIHYSNLERYSLSGKYRKIISLAVSQFNKCAYCIALHTSGAMKTGLLTQQECKESRQMKSHDPKINAILCFTKTILENRGHVKTEAIDKVKQQGFTDKDIVEAISLISLIIQANYVANVAKE